ncbi:MAG: sel1 repeat family protein [Clostridia bacterium]|nr:sel1 repeat family protein [Clostridia bacterium]
MLKYVYKNVNPKGKETADCVTRALVLATGMPYEEVVRSQMNCALETGESFANKAVYEKILKDHGYVKYKQPRRSDGTMYCIEEMDEILTDAQLSCGVFVTVNTHVSFIEGKNYYDIWDCGDCCVRNYYVKKPSDDLPPKRGTDRSDITDNVEKDKKPVSKTVKKPPVRQDDPDDKNVVKREIVKYRYEKTVANTAEEFLRLVTEENFVPGVLAIAEDEKRKVIEIIKAKLPEKKKGIITYLYIWIKTGNWSDDDNIDEIIDDLIDMANSGFPMAQNTLGYCYDNGYGVGQSNVEAATWFKKAAEQGYAVAQYNLGNCYDTGDYGIGQSYSKAAYWYEKAAKQGYAAAQKCFGDCFYYGDGAEQSYNKAVFWYMKSAEQGNEWAQYRLGQCYRWGDGVEQSYEKAIEWYKKSAAQGNAEAKDALETLQSLSSDDDQDDKSSENTVAKKHKTHYYYKPVKNYAGQRKKIGFFKMAFVYFLFFAACAAVYFMVRYDFATAFGDWLGKEISFQPHVWAHWGFLGKSSFTELISAPGSEMIFIAWPICIIGFLAEIVVWLLSYALYGFLWGVYWICFGSLWSLQHFLFLAGFVFINLFYLIKTMKNGTSRRVKTGYVCFMALSVLVTLLISAIVFFRLTF